MSLERITNSQDGYTVDDLNEALFAVFGELSPQIHASLAKEAKAIASTILNRPRRIAEKRKAHQAATEAQQKAQAVYTETSKTHDELAKNPTRFKKELGDTAYNKALAAAKADYETAKKALGLAEEKRIKASSEKIKYEAYLDPKNRNAQPVTLTHVVSASGQYIGYEKGKKDFKAFATMAQPDQERNNKRWNVAKSALEMLAKTPADCDHYIEFRANEGGKASLGKGRTRIGGNDFW